MSFRLGVDVGGTFTDLILVNEASGDIHTAKVPSTPDDSSVGVMNGVERVCANAGIDPSQISQVMHGTTVATNTVLTGTGAKVGLVTTRGYKQVLQIARSYVPGGLGGWVIYNKSNPLAPLACTIEAEERIGADGKVVRGLDAKALEKAMAHLKAENIEALTVSLINSYANAKHEKAVERVARKALPGVPISLSSSVVPEMQEYERTITTVANSYVRPKVAEYVKNLEKKLKKGNKKMPDYKLAIEAGLIKDNPPLFVHPDKAEKWSKRYDEIVKMSGSELIDRAVSLAEEKGLHIKVNTYYADYDKMTRSRKNFPLPPKYEKLYRQWIETRQGVDIELYRGSKLVDKLKFSVIHENGLYN